MGKLTVYVVLLFSVTVVLYLLGAQSPFLELMDSVDETKPAAERVTTALAEGFKDSSLLIKLGLGSAAVLIGTSAITGIGSSIALYALPLGLFTVFMNFFVLPTDVLFQQNLPTEISWIVFLFFNLLIFLSALEFTRGGGT